MKIKTGKFKGHILKVVSAKSASLDDSWGKFLIINQTLNRIGIGDDTKSGATQSMIDIAETGEYDFGDFDSNDLIQ
jgi:hypothetical protein